MSTASVATAPSRQSNTTHTITCGPCDLQNCPINHGQNIPPADDPTRKNPITLPDSPVARCAKPKVFGKTGATANPNPTAPNHKTNCDGGKTSRLNAINIVAHR